MVDAQEQKKTEDGIGLQNEEHPTHQDDSKTVRHHRINGAKMVIVNPPSVFHPDIHPPSLVRVQRALRAHTNDRGPRLHQRPRRALPASSFRDENGHFILHSSDGGLYVGDVLGGLPHGLGQHYIPDPLTGKKHMLYDGEWVHGSKTGYGSIFYTNGEEYRGDLRNNQRWGCGWLQYKNGSFYCGDWLRGRRHGIGLHYLKNGNCYHGAFSKDSQDGWGIYYWPSAHRKFEGEWVANQPYSGFYSPMDKGDLHFMGGMLLQYCPHSSLCPLIDKLTDEARQMAKLHLKNPFLTIFNVISLLQSVKAGDHELNMFFKSQVGRKEILSASQLQILKKLFEVMIPMVDDKAKLHVKHLRRMLVLARINPDRGQGEKLLAHLQEHTLGRETLGFDEFLQHILQFHNP